MTQNEIQFISEIAFMAGAFIVWRVGRRIEKRLGCKNDWQLIALVWRKINLLRRRGAKQDDWRAGP